MIVGTAGHIDHGKSALVRALTGVDTDRLKEEKARGISIDLGFAYMPVENGLTLGFVDVPGHEKFIRNMLAGAAGIDFVLVVVATDDGIMPQTREHLAIVDLLGKSDGLVALTKVDLVSSERRQEVGRDVTELLQSTGLTGARIMPVSAVTGEGVDQLREALVTAARSFRARKGNGRFRLAVDRSFSITGVGTIVTGAVVSGSVSVGDSVTVSPSGLKARVRSIHAQNQAAEQGHVGERCALNLTGDGVTRFAISRGDFVLDPFLHAPADRIDASVRLLESCAKPMAHWTPIRLYHGATEVSARVALLQESLIAPGAAGRIQLVLDHPIAAAVGDRFILRDTSGAHTLGGGSFMDLRAPHRRRRTPQRLAQLDALGRPELRDALAMALDRWPFFIDLAAFARDRALGEEEINAALATLPHKRIGKGPDALAFSSAVWLLLTSTARTAVEAFHQSNPQLLGLSPARLAGLMEPRLPPKIALAVLRALVDQGVLVSAGGAIHAPGHRLDLDKRDRELWRRLAPLLANKARFRPPRVADIAHQLAEREFDVRRVLKATARQRHVVEIATDHFFLRETVQEMAGIVADIAQSQPDGEFSAAQLRDRLNNGRKIAIQILEYFDRNGLTSRRDDLRSINANRLKSFACPQGAPRAQTNSRAELGS